MPYFSIPNLRARAVEVVHEPWRVRSAIPGRVTTRDELTEWQQEPRTRHYHLSLYEGDAGTSRVTEQNPPRLMHGMVGDYDAEVEPEDMEGLDRRLRARRDLQDPCPTWACRTWSGGARLFWHFERPVMWYGAEVHRAFLRRLQAGLAADGLLPGLDADAWAKPNKYFELGTGWRRLLEDSRDDELLLPSAWLEGLLAQASADARWQGDGGVVVPMDVVAAEVERRFPGRWRGPFEVGRRGVRFWDQAADNESAAVVRETGMQCFTGGAPFVSWADVFGRAFVDRYHADRVGRAVEGISYDQRKYWRKNQQGVWVGMGKDDCQLYLTQVGNLERAEGEVASALQVIHDTRVVRAAVPLLYQPEGVVRVRGDAVLNVSCVRPMAPLPEGEVRDWGDGFPWLAGYLGDLFEQTEDGEDQLSYFLAWLRWFYANALAGEPQPGQVLFVCGPVEQGKSFLSTCVVSGLMGGHADASRYMAGVAGDFNREVAAMPVACVDDTSMLSSEAQRQHFSSMIKRMAANPTLPFMPKYMDAYDVPWAGRVVVTHNDDAESMRVMPDVDQSLMDKVMMLKTGRRDRPFGRRQELARTVEAELPALARWLLQTTFPGIDAPTRFGVHCYHHPEMLADAQSQAGSARVKELLRAFRRAYFLGQPEREAWEGTAFELRQYLLADPSMSQLVGEFKTNTLGRQLGKLLDDEGEGLTRARAGHGNVVTWRIPRDCDATPAEVPRRVERRPR